MSRANAFLAVFSREFRLRRILLAGALLVGIAATLIPRIQGRTGSAGAEAALGSAILLAWVTAVLYAVLLGSGAVARDLADLRLGFDFARPLSGLAIWAGRFGSAVAILVSSLVLVLAPALLTGSRPGPGSVVATTPNHFLLPLDSTGWLALGIGGAVVLLFVVHALGVFFAARSAALGWDVAALGAVALLAAGAFGRFRSHWASQAYAIAALAFSGLAVVALVAASAAQVVVGRSDAARGHRALSLVLWGGLLLGAVGVEAGSRWLVGAEAADFDRVDQVVAAASGPWFSASGTARHRGEFRPTFLIDGESGRTVRIAVQAWASPTFSSDGSTAVWLDAEPGEHGTLMRLDLRRPDSRPETLGISTTKIPYQLALSPDGRYCAATAQGRLLVHELASGRQIASIARGDSWAINDGGAFYAWVAADRLRVYVEVREANEPVGGGALEIVELSATSGKLEKTGVVTGNPGRFRWSIGPRAETILRRQIDGAKREIFDGRTGAPLAVFEPKTEGTMLFLADGTIGLIERNSEGRTLIRYDRQGTELLRIALPGLRRLILGGMPTPDLLLAAGSESGPGKGGTLFDGLDPAGWQLLALDLRTGGVETIGRGVPAIFGARPVGGGAARLIRTAEPGPFARFDPATRRLVPIVLEDAS